MIFSASDIASFHVATPLFLSTVEFFSLNIDDLTALKPFAIRSRNVGGNSLVVSVADVCTDAVDNNVDFRALIIIISEYAYVRIDTDIFLEQIRSILRKFNTDL